MSDCRFGVSPVNYPDPDPESSSTDFYMCPSVNWRAREKIAEQYIQRH